MCKKTIKITSSDKFVWRVITLQEARVIMFYDLFSLYALHEDDTESLIADSGELESYFKDGLEVGIEVGFTNYKEVELLKSLIKSHDFYFERSDGQYYKRGKRERERIEELSKHVSREDFVRWWNRAAPESLHKIV